MAIAGSSINALCRVLLRLAAYTSKDGGETGLLQGGGIIVSSAESRGYQRWARCSRHSWQDGAIGRRRSTVPEIVERQNRPRVNECNRGYNNDHILCIEFLQVLSRPSVLRWHSRPKGGKVQQCGRRCYAEPSITGCDIPDHGNSRVFAEVSGLSFRH